MKPVVFTRHARERINKRGTTEDDVIMAIQGDTGNRLNVDCTCID